MKITTICAVLFLLQSVVRAEVRPRAELNESISNSEYSYKWRRRRDGAKRGFSKTQLIITSKARAGVRCELKIQLARQYDHLSSHSFKTMIFENVSFLKGKTYLKFFDFKNVDLPFRGEVTFSDCEFVRPSQKIASMAPDVQEVDTAIDGLLSYLQDTQAKKSNGEYRLKGEWGSRMVIRKSNPFVDATLGSRGKDKYDSNCFATAATHNNLSEIYLKYGDQFSNLSVIPEMTSLAIKKVMECEGEKGFGFWPYISLPEKWIIPEEERPLVLRGPKNFDFGFYWVQLLSNNVDDADDTAVSFLSLKLNKEVAQSSGRKAEFSNAIPNAIGPLFSAYRSSVEEGAKKGVFQTWFGENSGSFMAIGVDKKVIPLDANVVDCVVVSNVLGALASFDEMDTEGVQTSCNYVNRMVRAGEQFACGAYYPNKFSLHLSVAKALEAGASCLEESRETLIKDIESHQLTDGSWNTYDVDNDDIYQSSIYALNAFLSLKKINSLTPGNQDSDLIYRSLEFLFNNVHVEGKHVYWPAGNQFSGGPLLGLEGIRHSVVWRSRGVTNSLMLQSLLQIKTLSLREQ